MRDTQSAGNNNNSLANHRMTKLYMIQCNMQVMLTFIIKCIITILQSVKDHVSRSLGSCVQARGSPNMGRSL